MTDVTNRAEDIAHESSGVSLDEEAPERLWDPESRDDAVLPVKKGDWLRDCHNGSRLARVKDISIAEKIGEKGFEFLVDLVIYDRDGNRIGRESPALGGPRTFEPACSLENWVLIPEPSFPLTMIWLPAPGRPGYQTNGWSSERKSLPWRRHLKKPRKNSVLPPLPALGNGAEIEAAALRRSAQELRDMAKRISGDGKSANILLERATELEEMAKKLEN